MKRKGKKKERMVRSGFRVSKVDVVVVRRGREEEKREEEK